LTGIFLILDISANRLKGIWFWDLCYYCFVRFIWFFATSVPELGGTVGYELNLFLQDYRKNRDTFDFDFSDHLRVFLNLSSPERIQPSSKIQKKKKQI
jgi:S-DNA-T family DNA segregation ATPase FtsK/SpoIIIE